MSSSVEEIDNSGNNWRGLFDEFGRKELALIIGCLLLVIVQFFIIAQSQERELRFLRAWDANGKIGELEKKAQDNSEKIRALEGRVDKISRRK